MLGTLPWSEVCKPGGGMAAAEATGRVKAEYFSAAGPNGMSQVAAATSAKELVDDSNVTSPAARKALTDYFTAVFQLGSVTKPSRSALLMLTVIS